ncbi:MAG: hypothetical protein V3W04_01025 [Gammaproteobacteria bacterium]
MNQIIANDRVMPDLADHQAGYPSSAVHHQTLSDDLEPTGPMPLFPVITI